VTSLSFGAGTGKSKEKEKWDTGLPSGLAGRGLPFGKKERKKSRGVTYPLNCTFLKRGTSLHQRKTLWGRSSARIDFVRRGGS